MSFQEFFKRIAVVFLGIIILLGVWKVRGTLILAFLGIVLAVALSIPVNWLHRKRRWRRTWAIVFTVFIFLVVVFLVYLILFPTIFDEISRLFLSIPAAYRSLINLYEQFRGSNEIIADFFPPFDGSGKVDPVDQLLDQVLNSLGPIVGTGVPIILNSIGSLASIVLNFVLAVFLAILFLVDPLSYVKASLYLFPLSYHQRVLNLWNQLYQTLTTWIRALSFSITVTVLLVWLVLGVLLGSPNALIVAVFAGVATLIPNIGFWLPLLPILIFNLAADPAQLLVVIPAYLIIQIVESNFITPSIVKAELNIPAAGMMVCQLIFGILFGALGLFLAVPAVAVIIDMIREVISYGWLGLRGVKIQLFTEPSGRVGFVDPPARIDLK